MAEPDPRFIWHTEGSYTKSPLEFNFEEHINELRDVPAGDFTLVATLFDTDDQHMYSLTQDVHLQGTTAVAEEEEEVSAGDEEETPVLGEGAVASFVSFRRQVLVASAQKHADEFFTAHVKVISAHLTNYRLDTFIIPGDKVDLSLPPLAHLSVDLASVMRKSETNVFARDIFFADLRFSAVDVGYPFTCYLLLYDKTEQKYTHDAADDEAIFTVVRPEPSSTHFITLASELPSAVVDVRYRDLPLHADAGVVLTGTDEVALPFALPEDPSEYILHVHPRLYQTSPSSGEKTSQALAEERLEFPFFLYLVDPQLFSLDGSLFTDYLALFCSLSRVDGQPLDAPIEGTFLVAWKHPGDTQPIWPAEEEVSSPGVAQGATSDEPVHLTILSPIDTSRRTLAGERIVSGELPMTNCDLAVDPHTVPAHSLVLWGLVKGKKPLTLVEVQQLLIHKKVHWLRDRKGIVEGPLVTSWDCAYRHLLGGGLLGTPTTFILLCLAFRNREEINGWDSVVLSDPFPQLPALHIASSCRDRTLGGVLRPSSKFGTYDRFTGTFHPGEPFVVTISSPQLDDSDLNYALYLFADDRQTDFSTFGDASRTLVSFSHSGSYQFFRQESGKPRDEATSLLCSLFDAGSQILHFGFVPYWGDTPVSAWRGETAKGGGLKALAFSVDFSHMITGETPAERVGERRPVSSSDDSEMFGPEAPFTLVIPEADQGTIYLSDGEVL